MQSDKSLCALYNYLNNSDVKNREYYDLLRYVLDQKIYFFGGNFKNPHERKISFRDKLKEKAITLTFAYFLKFNSKGKKSINKIKIWSSAYFNVSDKFDGQEYLISPPPWIISKSFTQLSDHLLFKKVRSLQLKLIYADVKDLLTEHFFNEINEVKSAMKNFIIQKDIRALFLPNDLGFFEKLSIQIFKELDRPSFLLNHGLPGIYGSRDDNRTDYLVVWGEAIKQNYVNAGVNPDKILVNGHPKYNTTKIGNLKFDFDDILVLPKPLPGAPLGDTYSLSDRGNCIYYLLSLQNVLKKFGVSKVRLRPHPSENVDWYLKHLDNDFFFADMDDLETSLKRSSLVIGVTSTAFFEALLFGINYVVFEPRLENGNGLDNYTVVSPFDGNNRKVPSAKNEEELLEILQQKAKVDVSVLTDYINPYFDPKLILDKIK
ncbi:hypothetical protein [Pedobacter sp. UBA4863]|uniref:hypothetical protein n=1 Tax=Pedobacter sp. UBA4863 TaxID=1947060 RepID=UPI0025E07149|nr:hypothetical protein [Pedobacter sp. UBA4863]